MKQAVMVFIAFAFLCSNVRSAGNFTILHDGVYYYFHDDKVSNIAAASALCTSLGGGLARIYNLSTVVNLINEIETNGTIVKEAYIGLTNYRTHSVNQVADFRWDIDNSSMSTAEYQTYIKSNDWETVPCISTLKNKDSAFELHCHASHGSKQVLCQEPVISDGTEEETNTEDGSDQNERICTQTNRFKLQYFRTAATQVFVETQDYSGRVIQCAALCIAQNGCESFIVLNKRCRLLEQGTLTIDSSQREIAVYTTY